MAATRPGSPQRHPDKRRSAQERRPAASLALHPSSELVPAMSAAAYTQLRTDIERRGIQTPLEITAAGVLLDGRSRLQAARSSARSRFRFGSSPPTTTWSTWCARRFIAVSNSSGFGGHNASIVLRRFAV